VANGSQSGRRRLEKQLKKNNGRWEETQRELDDWLRSGVRPDGSVSAKTNSDARPATESNLGYTPDVVQLRSAICNAGKFVLNVPGRSDMGGYLEYPDASSPTSHLMTNASHLWSNDLGDDTTIDAQRYVLRPWGLSYLEPAETAERKKSAKKKDDADDDPVVLRPGYERPITQQLFSVLGTGINKRTDQPELVLVFLDRRGQPQRLAIPRKVIAAGERDLAIFLEGEGFRIHGDKRAKSLLGALFAQLHGPQVDILDRPGWRYDQKSKLFRFAHPLGMIGPESENTSRVTFDPSQLRNLHVAKKGTHKGWLKGVLEPSRGNSRLLFGLCAAVASPLLYFQNRIESRLFNLYGTSSKGKSTIMMTAGSVHGGSPDHQLMFANSWNSTPNALCGWAASHSNLFGALDEMPNDPDEAAPIIAFAYAFSAGVDKMRKDANAKDKLPETWRLVALSSAERPLEELAAVDARRRKHVAEGAQARVIDVPAVVGEFGAFECIHDYAGSREFADALRDAASEHYGHAGYRFIKGLVQEVNEVGEYKFRRELSDEMDSFVASLKLENASDIVKRVAQSFALVRFAGVLAVELGVFGKEIEVEEIDAACRKVFKGWLKARGGEHSISEAAPLVRLRDFLATNESRFVSLDIGVGTDEAKQQKSRMQRFAGYSKRYEGEEWFWVVPSVFETEVAGGKKSAASLATSLLEVELLDVTESERKAGRYTKKIRAPEQARFFAVNARAKLLTDAGKLEAGDETPWQTVTDGEIVPTGKPVKSRAKLGSKLAKR